MKQDEFDNIKRIIKERLPIVCYNEEKVSPLLVYLHPTVFAAWVACSKCCARSGDTPFIMFDRVGLEIINEIEELG